MDPALALSLQLELKNRRLNATIVSTGKDCQKNLATKSFDLILLDIQTKSHSAIEILNFIHLQHLPTRVYMMIESAQVLGQLQMVREKLERLGVLAYLHKQTGAKGIVQEVLSLEGFVFDDASPEEDEIQAELFEMSLIQGSELLQGAVASFDLYVHVVEKLYRRIIRKGEILPKRLTASHFIRNQDRIRFVQSMSQVISKLAPQESVQTDTKFRGMRSTVDHYITEFHTRGLNPVMVSEGRKVCESMYNLISEDKRIQEYLRSYEEVNPILYSKTFLDSFFAALIARSLPWGSKRTIEMVALGSLLQDVGLPPEDLYLLDKDQQSFTLEEKVRFESHPAKGMAIVKANRELPDAVSQIVFQHHELMNGEGFPNRIPGKNIYPLAKIVGLATGFTHDMLQQGTSPVKSLGEFAMNRRNLSRYEPEHMKALIKCFIKEK
jgi:response regulator RpfG family c-di-GMP phosphodiesterase